MNIYPYIIQYLLLKKTHFYHALSRSILQILNLVLNVGAENFLPLHIHSCPYTCLHAPTHLYIPLHTHTLPYTFIYAPLHIFVHMYFCPNHPYIYQPMNIYPYINQYLLLKKTHFYHALSRSILQILNLVLNVGAENFLPLHIHTCPYTCIYAPTHSYMFIHIHTCPYIYMPLPLHLCTIQHIYLLWHNFLNSITL
jgi:hypothetical protein